MNAHNRSIIRYNRVKDCSEKPTAKNERGLATKSPGRRQRPNITKSLCFFQEEAFGERPICFVRAYKKLRDEDQAKDIVQDVFATLWFKRDFNLPTSNLAGYLFTAVRNKIFDLFAHQKVQAKYMQSLGDYMQARENISTDHRVRANELTRYIEKQIEALPPKMRRIFEMSRKEHLSHSEIAEKTGTSENNISTQITSALRILRTKLGIIIFIFLFINSL